MYNVYDNSAVRRTRIFTIPYWLFDFLNSRQISLDVITDYVAIKDKIGLLDLADLCICNRLLYNDSSITDDLLSFWQSRTNINPLLFELVCDDQRILGLVDRLNKTNNISENKLFKLKINKTMDAIIVVLFDGFLNKYPNGDYTTFIKEIVKTLEQLIPYSMIPVQYPAIFRFYIQNIINNI
jgi:hypothetical protein